MLAFVSFLGPCRVTAQQSSPAVLPSVTAYALDRGKVTLPADFRAPLNMLVLSFERDQQPEVDAWFSTLSGMAGVQTWLLPVSPKENGVYRWWLNASLRGQAPSQPRHYTVPLYVNKAEFLRSLQVASEQDVAVLLTDKTGHVLWRANGPVNESKKAALGSFLMKLPQGAGQP